MHGPGLFTLFFTLILVTQNALAGDIAGSKDHPLFPRFAGSEIIGQKLNDYDEHTLALGAAYEASSSNYQLRDSQQVEGKVSRTLYLAPSGKTTLQVYRNYEKILKGMGFEQLFSCRGNKGCGWHSWFTGAQTLGGLRDYALQLGDDFRYLASHLKRKEGDLYVAMLVYQYDSSAVRGWQGRTMIEFNVIELEAMKEEMVLVKAEDLAKGIMAEGHAAVHQIYFDTASDTLKAESRAAIEQIAKLLKTNPELKIILVGHTDNQGELPYNMDLSQRRAKAVMTALENDFAIPRERLGAAGLGYLAPVASNRSEAGRAMNRRVELIEQ